MKEAVRETSEECREKVKGIFSEIDVGIPDSVTDTAHCIGKVSEKDSKHSQQIIVRVTTWCHHTMV